MYFLFYFMVILMGPLDSGALRHLTYRHPSLTPLPTVNSCSKLSARKYCNTFIFSQLLCVLGTVMVEHVLKICEKDGNFDNIYL